MKNVLIVLILAASLSGCGTVGQRARPEAVITVQEVVKLVPTACKGLTELGDDPIYSDADESLVSATDLLARVQLLLLGRQERDNRLRDYRAVTEECKKIPPPPTNTSPGGK